MSLVDEEFFWFWCGNEAQAICHGPFQDQWSCEKWAYDPELCDHGSDHMVFRSTGRQLVERLPASAWYSACSFFVPSGNDEVEAISGKLCDLGVYEKIQLYDEMADVLEQRNSSKSDVMASTSPSARW